MMSAEFRTVRAIGPVSPSSKPYVYQTLEQVSTSHCSAGSRIESLGFRGGKGNISLRTETPCLDVYSFLAFSCLFIHILSLECVKILVVLLPLTTLFFLPTEAYHIITNAGAAIILSSPYLFIFTVSFHFFFPPAGSKDQNTLFKNVIAYPRWKHRPHITILFLWDIAI